MQGRKSLLNLKKHLHRTFPHFQIKKIELPTIVLTKFSNYNVHMLLISHHKKNYLYILTNQRKKFAENWKRWTCVNLKKRNYKSKIITRRMIKIWRVATGFACINFKRTWCSRSHWPLELQLAVIRERQAVKWELSLGW